MKNRALFKASLVYNLLMNLGVCFFLCLASNVAATHWNVDWEIVLFNLAISYPVAVIVGMSIPLVKLGRIVTNWFGVNNVTFEHNMLYRIIATFFYSCIYFSILNPFLTTVAILMGHASFPNFYAFFISWLRGIPLMLIVGFTASMVFDRPCFLLARRIYPDF